MILLLSFMPPSSSCFFHIKCSLTISASKIQDLQMPSPLCSFFWFFLCRPRGKTGSSFLAISQHFSVLLLLHLPFLFVYAVICVFLHHHLTVKLLIVLQPLWCGYQSSGSIFEARLNWDLFKLVLVLVQLVLVSVCLLQCLCSLT